MVMGVIHTFEQVCLQTKDTIWSETLVRKKEGWIPSLLFLLVEWATIVEPAYLMDIETEQ